ncbi:hypothetical protein DEMA109039_05015 [Deinococcus marmoris]
MERDTVETDSMDENLRINLPVQGDPRIERLMRLVAAPVDVHINEIARDSLAMFVVHAERAVQQLTLTEPEVGALLSMMNGTGIEPGSAHHLALWLEDALEYGLAEEWDIDGTNLQWRIEAMHPFDVAVLAMTLRAAWNVSGRFDGNPMAAARALGLLPATTPSAP